jgi:hypothetical protein
MGKSKTPQQNVKTEGGSFIGGNVSMGDDSKFVGRDDYSRTSLRNERKRKIRAKQKTNLAIIKALVAGGISITIFEVFVYQKPWTWLIVHPSSYGLQLAVDVLLLLLACALFLVEWRKYIIGSLLIPIFGFLLTLLKESNKP